LQRPKRPQPPSIIVKTIYASTFNPTARIVHSPDGAAEIRTTRNWLSYTETLSMPMCEKYGINYHTINEADALNLALELAYLSGKINTSETP
jgi:hypothetical protein